MVLGVAALGGAVTAAVARSLTDQVEEGLRVWMVAGGMVFVVSGLAALVGLPTAATWSILLVGSMFASRFVPSFAVDVPDQLLIDLERLAVTAWSARDRPRGRRGRAVASPQAVAGVARSGARLVTAAAAAIAVISVGSAGLLLSTVTWDLDRSRGALPRLLRRRGPAPGRTQLPARGCPGPAPGRGPGLLDAAGPGPAAGYVGDLAGGPGGGVDRARLPARRGGRGDGARMAFGVVGSPCRGRRRSGRGGRAGLDLRGLRPVPRCVWQLGSRIAN